MSNSCCPRLIPTATEVVTTGVSVVITALVPTVAPTFSQCLTFSIPVADNGVTTGQEAVSLIWGGTAAPIVDSCGRAVPSQMLSGRNGHRYTVQFGLANTTPVFFARRGFKCRRTTTVAPA